MRSRVPVLMLLLAVTGDASAQAPRLNPVGMFGCGDCTGPLLFATVHALSITPDGLILVADDDAPRIRVFDVQGRLRHGFGRRGAGPGELRLPIGLGVVDGSVAVVDMTSQRITRYRISGEVAGTQRLSGFPTLAAFPPADGPPLLGFTDFRRPEVTLGRVVGDSVRELRRIGAAEFPERLNGGFDIVPLAVAPDGSFAVGDGIGSYRILRYHADGTPLDTIRRDIARVRHSTDELRALAEQRDRSFARARARAEVENRSAAASLTPPPIRAERNFFNAGSLAFDERGRLWVRVERGPLTQTGFDVFDGEGRYAGEVRVAARIRGFTLGAGLLVGVILDELDVPRIGVWRIE